MILVENSFLEMINNPAREIRARVELLEGSTLINTFKYNDKLISFTIERIGENKFFGFGVSHKINVKLIDKNRELDITTANTLDIAFGVNENYCYPFAPFKVSEVRRDENTNQLSITAYDALNEATRHSVSELCLTPPYTIRDVAKACATILGLPYQIVNVNDSVFDTNYEVAANFEGTETIREALNDIAEATQTIYYIDGEYRLTFKRLDMSGEAVVDIDKNRYFTLESKNNRRLTGICSATELGDNVASELEQSGTTQYVRDNAFWVLRDDVATLVNNALAAIGGLTINQFEVDWRGNFLVEIGDKLAITQKDGSIVYSYLLDDVITYQGAYQQTTRWSYEAEDSETMANPSTLGDALNQTFARVDKVNKQITIVASENQANREAISSLQMDTANIRMSVQQTQEQTTNAIDSVNENINTLTSRVEASMSAEDVRIEITKQLDNGVDKVITSTGFTFDEEGLTVSKSGSEMETTITEDGMTVYKDGAAMLTANNEGVEAIDLHATTYLIIGKNSRIEDYGDSRTGCFWIGG